MIFPNDYIFYIKDGTDYLYVDTVTGLVSTSITAEPLVYALKIGVKYQLHLNVDGITIHFSDFIQLHLNSLRTVQQYLDGGTTFHWVLRKT